MSYLRSCLIWICVIITVPVQAGDIVNDSFRSASLERDYRYNVYLPDGYDKDDLRYPILYLLHGAGGSENDWLTGGELREIMDDLISRQLIRPMVVVMPGHSTAWWVDGASEPGETALIKELMPEVQAKYRIAEGRGNRLLAGLSAGGYGTLNSVLKYPQMFAAAAIFSPAIYDPLPPSHSAAMVQPPFQKNGKFDPELWKSLSYVTHLNAYLKSGVIVPLYISSGDHDNYGIALQAAMLYEKLRLHQPNAIELRIVDGDHEWSVWRQGLVEALSFMNAHLAEP